MELAFAGGVETNLSDPGGAARGPDLAEPRFREFVRLAGRDDSLPNLRDWVELAEAWRIACALEQCRGNRSAAARALGIGRRTLYTKMEKLGITEEWSAPRLAGLAERQ
jgi:DNA-binding NtrC family response regulator